MKLPLVMGRPYPPAVRLRAKVPPGALRSTVPDLCRRAGIIVQATTDRPVVVFHGRRSIRTPGADYVAVPCSPRSREGALRALEALAHAFHDPCARHCVCKRGYFCPPVEAVEAKGKRKHHP